MISNSRGPHTLAGVVAGLEGNVRAGTAAQAVQFGEVVAIATPLPAVLDLPTAPFTGRIVVDVKAFNTIYFRRLLDDSQPNRPATERLAIPVAGDDADAKRTVIDLIDQIGFTAVDTGTLAESRRQQPGSSLYRAFAKARAAGETLTASRARQLLAAQVSSWWSKCSPWRTRRHSGDTTRQPTPPTSVCPIRAHRRTATRGTSWRGSATCTGSTAPRSTKRSC
jgi:8-hydroxy-5-deazaflavin:NADPH oxidoreductase